MRLAFAGEGPQIELIESLDGSNIYTEWIARQTGRATGLDGDGGFAYFGTEDLLGVIAELIEVPSRCRASEKL
jgi:methylmalonyl-CoA/ethylmalonyl-CoA epimerase